VRALQPECAHQRRDHPEHGAPKRGREIYIGLVTDDPFGPVIAFGAGGTMIELMNDRAMELPPLNQFLARRLIERSRVPRRWASGAAPPAVDMDALEQVLLRVSEMVCELPQLREMDINPIIVDESGRVAVDARIVIDHARRPWRAYPQLQPPGHPALPARTSRCGRCAAAVNTPSARSTRTMPTCCRPWCRSLSPESRYFRFVSSMHELPPQHAVALHADRLRPRDGAGGGGRAKRRQTSRGLDADGEMDHMETERIVGVSRYITNPDQLSQLRVFAGGGRRLQPGQGLGSRLMLSIMDVAREKACRDRRPGAGQQPRTTCSS
jgi:acetyltransferase